MSMSNVCFECKLCKYQTKNYDSKWVEHLLKKSHQINARKASCSRSRKQWILSKKKEKKNRSCVVVGIQGLCRKDVLSSFASKGVVTDCIFWTESPDICLLEFLSPRMAARTAKNGTKIIKSRKVDIRLRSSISDDEWGSICLAEADLNKSEETRTCKVEPEEPDIVIICERLHQQDLTDDGNEPGDIKPPSESISNTQDVNMDVDVQFLHDGIPTGNSKYNVNSVDETWSNFLSSNPTELLFHDLHMTIPKPVRAKATAILQRKSKSAGESCGSHLNTVLLSMITKFNSLIWENCFGIKCYLEGQGKIQEQVEVKGSKAGYRQHGSKFMGILTSTEKIKNWVNDRNSISNQPRKIRKDHLKSLITLARESPLKQPTPLTEEVVENLSANVLLCFEATVLCHKRSVVLRFENVICSENVDCNKFRNIVRMYSQLWSWYSKSELLHYCKVIK